MRNYRVLLIASLLSSCSAATQPLADSRSIVYHGSAGTATIYSERIVIETSGDQVVLQGCSTDEVICYRSGPEMISITRKCPPSIVEYYTKNENFRFVGYVHDVVTVKPAQSEKIMFSYAEEMGITAIYYDFDGSGTLRDRGPGRGVDRVAAQRIQFLPKQSRRAFACERR